MTTIITFRLRPNQFELGTLLQVTDGERAQLEPLVPDGARVIPLVWVHTPDPDRFVNAFYESATADLAAVDLFEDCVLLALDWNLDRDPVFRGITACNGILLGVTGTADRWEFDVRFRTHESLSRFRQYCERTGIELSVVRVYRASKPSTDPWLDVTDAQREALALAVDRGYYSIPRRCTTAELAATLGISDWSVTERLRRGIVNLATSAFRLDPPRDTP